MVSRADQRRGGTSPNSVVSVADLLARDAPWAGAPSAVAVAKRTTPAPFVPAQRTGSPGQNGPSMPRAVSKVVGDGRLRQIASAAWTPQWRFVTIAAAVLFAGLMANGVMLVTFGGPGHSTSAEAGESGYPDGPTDEDPNAASRVYDDGSPVDSALTPMFSSPGTGDLSAANRAGGLPMTLTSLGTNVPAASPARTTVLRGTPVVSTPVRAVSPTTTSTGTGTGSTSTSSKSSSSSTLGNVVRDTTSGLGDTVEDTTTGLGKTLNKTTDGLGKTLGNVTDDLLGGGSSKSKDDSSSDHSSSRSSKSESKSSSNGGLLGGLLGK